MLEVTGWQLYHGRMNVLTRLCVETLQHPNQLYPGLTSGLPRPFGNRMHCRKETLPRLLLHESQGQEATRHSSCSCGWTQQAQKLLVVTLNRLKPTNAVQGTQGNYCYKGPGNGHVMKRAWHSDRACEGRPTGMTAATVWPGDGHKDVCFPE